MSLFDGIRNKSLELALKNKGLKMQMKVLESMPEFAKDPDEGEWYTLGLDPDVEYSDVQMQGLRKRAQALYYTSPIARGVINTLINFIIGRSFKIIPDADDEKIKEYWDNFWESNKMDLRVKEWVRKDFIEGETFLRLFDGVKENDPPITRFYRPSQITSDNTEITHGIETSDNDIEEVINYHREYFNKAGEKQTEVIPADKMIHTKIMVDSDVKRGLSFLIGIIKYILDYTDWLNDRKNLNKIRSIFNLIATPTGSGTPTTFKDQFTDTTKKSTSGGSDGYNKKMPKSGSIIGSKGMDYKFASLNLSAADTQHDGRAILLMIVAGTNLAEYMVTGDASNANYSSTMVSESPAVRTFEAWQDFFSHEFKELYKRVIMEGVKNGTLPDKYMKKTEDYDSIKKEVIVKEELTLVTGKCSIEFPVLIHRDIDKDTKALILQNGNKLISKRKASTLLGNDYEEESKQIIRETQEEMEMAMPEEEDHNHDDE